MSLRERIQTFIGEEEMPNDIPDKFTCKYRFKPSICEFLKGVRHINDDTTKLERFRSVFVDVKTIAEVEDFYEHEAEKMFKEPFEMWAIAHGTVGIFNGPNHFWNMPLSAVEAVE